MLPLAAREAGKLNNSLFGLYSRGKQGRMEVEIHVESANLVCLLQFCPWTFSWYVSICSYTYRHMYRYINLYSFLYLNWDYILNILFFSLLFPFNIDFHCVYIWMSAYSLLLNSLVWLSILLFPFISANWRHLVGFLFLSLNTVL